MRMNVGTLWSPQSTTPAPSGPTRITQCQDFHLREKISHFDHERIPERVVHARGAAAHGYFQVYDNSLAQYTKAAVLIEPARKMPVFVRFSTVRGSRGSADTARDVRGFAVKFYTMRGTGTCSATTYRSSSSRMRSSSPI